MFAKTDYVRPRAKVPRKRLRELVSQMKGRCAYCGIQVVYPKRGNTHKKEYDQRIVATTDHVIPLNKGGKHSPVNMVCCCFACNASKRNRTLEEFRVNLFNRVTGTPVFSEAQIIWLEECGFTLPNRYVPFFFEEQGLYFVDGVGFKERE